jgi:preprotein translocase subunit YajC
MEARVANEFDLNKFTEAELVELNHQIVERLRLMRQVRRYEQMAALDPGERVSFTTDSGQIISGMVVRFNHKTVTVRTDDGMSWRVSPAFLSKTTEGVASNVRELHPRAAAQANPGPLFDRK